MEAPVPSRELAGELGGPSSPASDGLVVGSRYFRNVAEFSHWHEIQRRGFTDWYGGAPAPSELRARRREANARARLFPDFVHQVRTIDGKAVAYLTTVPGYWSGDKQAFHDLHYYLDALALSAERTDLLSRFYFLTVELLRAPQLFDRMARRFREPRLAGANCVVMVSIVVDPEYQKLQIPSTLIAAAKDSARRLGMRYVVGPFRPNRYGPFKAEHRLTHSSRLFEEYCGLQNDQGLPRDPWMRVLARNGVEFLKPEPRSYTVSGSFKKFEKLRQTFKPESWYCPSPDTWECGETPTWYVDRFRKAVISVEPNVWGFLAV